jgi:DNA-binding response OmpR family regulator
MSKLSVLLIEDTVAIAARICDYLEAEGMEVDYASNGAEGIRLAQQQAFDVILLDLMLPDMDGKEICQILKRDCDPIPPILMLTARDSIDDKTQGFDAGADDYLTKPFALPELLVRCKALARRSELHQSQRTTIGELVVHEKQQRAERCGQALSLSSTDFAILLLLVKAYPNAVSRQQIINKVWGDDFPDTDVLRSHVYTLRQALDKPFAYPMLKTVHALGFKLEA